MQLTVRRFALFAALLLTLMGSRIAQAGTRDHYTFRDLGTLPGTTQSSAAAINNRRQVVGTAWSGDSNYAVLWDNGKIIDLGSLGGRQLAYARDINDRGQIVGSAITGSEQMHAFLWEDGRMTDLGAFGGIESFATAINNRGQITGQYVTSAGEGRAFLWERGNVTDLGQAGTYTGGSAINDRGDIAGNGFFIEEDVNLGVLWKRGVLARLPTLPGDHQANVSSINNRGQIVGSSLGDPNNAVCWFNGNVRSLGLPNSGATAINDRGQIVGGWRQTANAPASVFLWERGTVTVLPTPTLGEASAADINARGQVVGTTTTVNQENHATLWTP